MQTNKRASFYTDISKQQEFIARLNAILNEPDSSISNCYLARSTSDRYCLFITPFNAQYDFTNITFDFCNFFSNSTVKDDDFYSRYVDQGLSKTDVDRLSDLLDAFAFENFYEGLFFASKFFEPELNPLKVNSLYFKFTANEEDRLELIDGKKLEKHYSVTTRQNLAYELSRDKSIDLNANLIKCNTYSFSQYKKLDFCLREIKKTNGNYPTVEKLVVVQYRDLEYYNSYIQSVFALVDDELVEVDIKDIVNTAEVEED
jgi:uncharacterized protein YuzB (UPF0349 family)